ncbi:MAG: emp24p/erv25p- protein [Chrysothrix sp. TS-e1954]|nr:MAG: emp24p/erv25p- protein [Chrysothrix sp. TS-e1954]
MRLRTSPATAPGPFFLGLVTLLSFISSANGLYFYMDGKEPKCFYEELPRGTLVVGKTLSNTCASHRAITRQSQIILQLTQIACPGHFNAELYDQSSNSHKPNAQLTTLITVEEVFDNDHRVVSQKSSSSGRFTFSAADSGSHRICFTADNAPSGGWLSSGAGSSGVKFNLDLAIGETSAIESTDKGKMDDIVDKVKDLNGRLMDIRREQVFQREREAEFRDQSELTNARVVRWTVVQLVILGLVCFWQLSHLRAFFIKQKLT